MLEVLLSVSNVCRANPEWSKLSALPVIDTTATLYSQSPGTQGLGLSQSSYQLHSFCFWKIFAKPCTGHSALGRCAAESEGSHFSTHSGRSFEISGRSAFACREASRMSRCTCLTSCCPGTRQCVSEERHLGLGMFRHPCLAPRSIESLINCFCSSSATCNVATMLCSTAVQMGTVLLLG